MLKKIVAAGVGIALFASPLVASAQTITLPTIPTSATIEQLQALITQLTQIFQHLLAQRMTVNEQAVGYDAHFLALPASGAAPLSVTFVAAVGGPGYVIDFGDGVWGGIYRITPVAERSYGAPPHTYMSVGTYTAKLYSFPSPYTVDCSQSSWDPSCRVVGTATITVRAPLSITCSGTPYNASTPWIIWSAVASGGSGDYTHEWNLFGDVTSIDNSIGVKSSKVQTAYGSVGTKRATVVVRDGVMSAEASCSATTDAASAPTTVPTISSFTTSASSVVPLQPVTLSFTATAVNSCSVTSYDSNTGAKINDLPGFSAPGTAPINASFMVTPDRNTTYMLTCVGANNSTAAKSVTVKSGGPTVVPSPVGSITSADDFIRYLYRCALGGEGDQSGVAGRVSRLTSGAVSVQGMYQEFFLAAQYQSRGLDNTRYVSDLYRCVLFREGEASGVASRSQALSSQTRTAALNELLAGAEFTQSVLPVLQRVISSGPLLMMTTPSTGSQSANLASALTALESALKGILAKLGH